jgi:hypothetical protein
MLAIGGCTWVYDGQYDDRAAELEAFRTEFLPASDQVRFITSAEDKLFWVSLEKPLDEPMLHSYDPATDQRIDYEWSRGETNLDVRYRFGTEVVIKCNFSTVTAFDATMPDVELGQTDQGSERCAVDGGSVYFAVAREIRRWTPGPGTPVKVVDLDANGIGEGSIGGFAVLGNGLLLEEGGRLWRIDLVTGVATWLENEDPVSGAVFFDDRGVLYGTNGGTRYTRFADLSSFGFDEAVADGGYSLNFKHPDIHEPADGGDRVLHGLHVIYRARRGVFAYGLESTKVTDLLLDRGESFEAKPVYRHIAVTTGGTLFAQDDNGLNSADKPVYRVDLSGRLR